MLLAYIKLLTENMASTGLQKRELEVKI